MSREFEYGQAVRVVRNIRNDGTYPGEARGALLVRRGSVGYVRDRGTFLQDQVIYSVHFLDQERLVGCRDGELQPAETPWIPNRFELGDRVEPRIPLGIQGRILIEPGVVGEILRVLRDHPSGVTYHVLFPGRAPLQVPETALMEAADDRGQSDGVPCAAPAAASGR